MTTRVTTAKIGSTIDCRADDAADDDSDDCSPVNDFKPVKDEQGNSKCERSYSVNGSSVNVDESISFTQ